MTILKAQDAKHPDTLFSLHPAIGFDLHINGKLQHSDAAAIAIVGTRKPSIYGIEMARIISEQAVKAGYTVVSGLARGIDTEAHRTALKSGGRTIAVLGTGIDTVYPEENIGLAMDISKHGAVMSQFPYGTPPLRRNFPLRNNVVAKLSQKLFLIEAPVKSGSLITARLALEAGKEVCVLPGRLGENSFTGNLSFMEKHRDNPQVSLITNIEKLFNTTPRQERLIPAYDVKKEIAPPPLDTNEKVIYDILLNETHGLHFDAIVLKSGFSAADLPAVLLSLTLQNVIEELPGKIFNIARGLR